MINSKRVSGSPVRGGTEVPLLLKNHLTYISKTTIRMPSKKLDRDSFRLGRAFLKKSGQNNRYELENLEPRILLSADGLAPALPTIAVDHPLEPLLPPLPSA